MSLGERPHMSGDTQTCDHAELIRVLEELPEGVLIIDSDEVIVFANKPGARLVKLKLKKALGSRFEHDIQDGAMRDFDVEMTVKEISWAGQPARLLHLKSLKSAGAFHLEWKLEAAVERARELEQELEELKKREPESGSESSPAADTSYFEERIAELEHLLELAEQRADQMEGDIARDDHEQSQALQDALRHARDAEEQVRQLEDDLEESRERIRVAEEQAEVAEERAYAVELELEQHLGEQEEDDGTLQELQQEVEDLRVYLTTWRESADRLTAELEESENRNKELSATLEELQLQQQEENATSQLDEEQLSRLQETITELESALKEAQDDRQLAQEESGELAEQLRLDSDQFEERTLELESRIGQLETELASSLARTEELELEKQEALVRLEVLEQDSAASSELEQRLAELEEAAHGKAELEERLFSLEERTQTDAAESAAIRERLEAELAELQVEKQAFEGRCLELESAAQSAADALAEELAREKQLLQERTSEVEQAGAELNRLNKDVRRLEKLLKNAEELAQKGEKVEKLERKLEGALRRAEEAEERLLEERRLLNEMRARVGKGQESQPSAASGESESPAFQDPLTGLPSRSILDRYLGFMLEQSSRHNRLSVLIRIDCDNFQKLNETYGTPFCDRLLRLLGERLSSVVRGTDVLGRLEEDEFVLFLSELSSQDEASVMTAAVVKRVYQRLRQPFVIDDEAVYLNLSMGVSVFPADARNGEEMFEHSAVALQQAKEKGKGRCQYYRTEFQDQHEARAQLDAQLTTGLEKEQFDMQYQPIFDLKSGQVIGLEALMRWNHPQHGVLNPDSFLKIAEDSGLIVVIGNWAMRHTLRQAAEWQRHGVAGFVSINLSRRQLMQSELVPNLSSMLAEFGCVPDRILFEVPEVVTGPDNPQIRATLNELTRIGVKLAVDNFGTSSTSLKDLRQGPFTVIKVDRKFVRGLPGDEVNTGIVLSALHMGHHLGRISVAVGVEGEPERKWLEQIGCLYAQGNALSPPLPAEQVAEFVKRSG